MIDRDPLSAAADVPLPPNADRLRRVQTTLSDRITQRDRDNIRAIGFAPADNAKMEAAGESTWPMTVHVEVAAKRVRVAAARRVRALESVRLLDRDAGSFEQLDLATDVVQTAAPTPVAVRLRTPEDSATTAVVVRWTTRDHAGPPPPQPADDSAWRWGVISVSHLLTGRGPDPARHAAAIDRVLDCGPAKRVEGAAIAAGRILGGPDIAVFETGLDRLWLSGFLTRIDASPMGWADQHQLLNWTATGTAATLWSSRGKPRGARWEAYFPTRHLPGLGRLQDIVRFAIDAPASDRPLRPGASGSLLVARGGTAIGLLLAAVSPAFTVGYVQTFDRSIAWLKQRLRAKRLDLLPIAGD